MNDKHKLRQERINRGKTQKVLGAEAGVSPSTISHIECHRGPDVPVSQRRPTKTRTATALRLVVALELLAAGEYTFEEFVARQSIFTEAELYEALENELKRAEKRARKQRLTLVA